MKNMRALARFLAVGAAALAVLAVASSARAATITVLPGTVTAVTGPPAGFIWTYSINEDPGGRLSPGTTIPGESTSKAALGNVVADYFTIYDFVGFIVGSNIQPTNWSFQSLMKGSTDDAILVFDSPTITNLTWYYTGPATTNSIDFAVGPFSAQSTFGIATAVLGSWTGEDTHNAPADTEGTHLSDGRTDASIGDIVVPGSVPEPGSMLLLGTGLFGLAGAVRRRMKK